MFGEQSGEQTSRNMIPLKLGIDTPDTELSGK